MLTSSNMILIAFVGILIIFLIMHNNSCTTSEKFRPVYTNNMYDDTDTLVDDVASWKSSLGSNNSSGRGSGYGSSYSSRSDVTKGVLNPNFVNIQWHNDYRDVMTAILNLVPEKRQRFNLANIPLKYSEPPVKEVASLVKDFVYIVNENIKNVVPVKRNASSGWDEAIVDPNVEESGWAKVNRLGGLPSSLFEDPAAKSPVKIITIKYVQKYETDDEIRYVIDLILQKLNIADQIIVKVSFVQDKRPLSDENNFFTSKKIDMRVVIEDVFILGFLSKEGPDSQKDFDLQTEKYYDYNTLEQNNLTDPKYVQHVLMDKYKQKLEETEQRNALLDEEGQAFYKNLPHLWDYSNVKGTRTILDDMNSHKIFY